MATGVVVCPIESCFVLSAVARARRINMRTKFPGNKKEAAAVDANADDASQLTQRDLSRYFCVAPARPVLCSEHRAHKHARARVHTRRNTRNADGWREREADFVEF